MTNPSSLDWRNRWGLSWVTGIRDQDPCEACWDFAATALMESMVRINQGVWCIRSEGDPHDGMGAKCGSCGNADAALSWMETKDSSYPFGRGIADPDCYGWPDNRAGPYFNPAPNTCLGASNYTGSTVAANYDPTSDRSGRSVRVDSHVDIGNVNDQKTWLDTVGPLVCGFDVYDDFFSYGSGVYRKSSGATYAGGHVMLVVGYDDTQGYWIVKNSWGSNWGMEGYVYIGYGECNIDNYAKTGVSLTNPDPWTKRRLHSGNILESGDGANHRNFEMLVCKTRPPTPVQHWWRNNDVSGFPWSPASSFGNDLAVTFPTLTATTFNRNFETVYLTSGKRLHHWYLDQNTGKWNDGGIFGPADAVSGPGFIQSNYGAPGNFEVVVGTADKRLNHWWRDNSKSSYPWNDGGRFGSNVAYAGASLIQSNFGTKGNFELVCTLQNGQMQHWWRDNDDPNTPWAPSVTFGSNVKSGPCMIESMYGATNEYSKGNFELCVAVGGYVQHWWRDNNGNEAWTNSATFGDGHITRVGGLLEGSFGFNLELIVERDDGHIQHYYRDSSMLWHAAEVIV